MAGTTPGVGEAAPTSTVAQGIKTRAELEQDIAKEYSQMSEADRLKLAGSPLMKTRLDSSLNNLNPSGTPDNTSSAVTNDPGITADVVAETAAPIITNEPVVATSETEVVSEATQPVVVPASLQETAAAPQTAELGEKKFTEFTLEDWKNYIEQNNLKTIKLGKNTTVFPLPNQDGNYIAVTSDMNIGVIEIKHDDLNMLKVALEARLKETEVADPVFDVYRRSRETVQKDDALGRYFLAIVEGSYDSPLITRHPVEPVSDNKIISDALEINKIKSAEETITPVPAPAA